MKTLLVILLVIFLLVPALGYSGWKLVNARSIPIVIVLNSNTVSVYTESLEGFISEYKKTDKEYEVLFDILLKSQTPKKVSPPDIP